MRYSTPTTCDAGEVQVLIMGLFWTASPKRAVSLVEDIVKRGYRPVAAKSQCFTFMDEHLLEQGAGNARL